MAVEKHESNDSRAGEGEPTAPLYTISGGQRKVKRAKFVCCYTGWAFSSIHSSRLFTNVPAEVPVKGKG